VTQPRSGAWRAVGWRPLVAAAIFAAIGGLFVYQEFIASGAGSGPGQPIGVIDEDLRPATGEPAPDFALRLVDSDEVVRLSDFRGQTVLLNFWATWCPPCRAEMPEFQAVYEGRLPDGDFVVLAVDLEETDAQVQRFLDELGLTFPVAMDHAGEVARHYGVRGLPATFFIDRDGIVRERVLGPVFGNLLHDGIAAADRGGAGE
jgi:peroxiredoxin